MKIVVNDNAINNIFLLNQRNEGYCIFQKQFI